MGRSHDYYCPDCEIWWSPFDFDRCPGPHEEDRSVYDLNHDIWDKSMCEIIPGESPPHRGIIGADNEESKQGYGLWAITSRVIHNLNIMCHYCSNFINPIVMLDVDPEVLWCPNCNQTIGIYKW